MENLQRSFPSSTFIVAGDFNKIPEVAGRELNDYGLNMAQAYIGTASWEGTTSRSLNDHIASNAIFKDVCSAKRVEISDHHLLYTSLFTLHRPTHAQKHTIHKINNDLKHEEVLEILLSDDWPKKPLFRQSIKYNKAHEIKVEGDGLRKFRKFSEALV